MKGRFLALLVFGILLTGIAFGAYAQDSIKIIVNGRQITSEVAPFIKEGRTMVPLRVISEALGADVTWDQATGTVTIMTKITSAGTDKSEPELEKKQEPQQKPESPVENDLTKDNVNLSELKPVDDISGRVFYKNWGDNPDGPRGVFSIDGKKYFDGIGMLNYSDSKGSVVVSYNINGAYKKLTATVGASDIDANPYSGKTYLQIYGDDNLLYKSGAFKYTDSADNIDVNIDGVKVLRLVSYAEKGVGVNNAVWGDIMLHKNF